MKVTKTSRNKKAKPDRKAKAAGSLRTGGPLRDRCLTAEPGTAAVPAAAPTAERSEPPKAGRGSDGRFLPGNPSAFEPGRSGNPRGRPKNKTLAEIYRQALESPSLKEPAMTVAEVIAMNLVRHAERGIDRAIRELADRAYGRPRLAIETINNPVDAERWFRLSSVLVAALDPFPDAKLALLAALDKWTAEDNANAATN